MRITTRVTCFALALAAVISLGGCGDDATHDEPGAPGPTTAPEPASERSAAVDEVPDDLPIAEDFADEAEQAIDEHNYEAELERLAGTIESDVTGHGE